MSSDVFLSHNSQDKPAIRQLNRALQEAGLSTWFDEKDLPAGKPWIDELETALKSTRSIVVAIGKNGLGPWETPEMRAALIEMVRRKVPVIPLLLPDAPQHVELPLFLQTVTWVDCRDGFTSVAIDGIRATVSGTPSTNEGQHRSISKKPPSSGIPAFVEFCSQFQSSISLAARVGFLLPILPLVLGLEPPWDATNTLQGKCAVGAITLVVQVLAVTSVFVLLRKRSPLELRKYFKWSLIIATTAFLSYLLAFMLFTEIQPETHTRLIAGFLKTKEFYAVLEANNHDYHQTKLDFGYDPMRIFVPWTVWVAMIIVLFSWLAFFGAFIFYLGSFVQSSAQESPMTDDRALVVLNLPQPIRTLLHSRGLETVGDLCALSPRQLEGMLGNLKPSMSAITAALAEYGIELRQSS